MLDGSKFIHRTWMLHNNKQQLDPLTVRSEDPVSSIQYLVSSEY